MTDYRHADGSECECSYRSVPCPGRAWIVRYYQPERKDTLRLLRGRRLECWNRAKRICELTAAENRQLTRDEYDVWNALNEELRVLDNQIGMMLGIRVRR